jgi:hypothetical protein
LRKVRGLFCVPLAGHIHCSWRFPRLGRTAFTSRSTGYAASQQTLAKLGLMTYRGMLHHKI